MCSKWSFSIFRLEWFITVTRRRRSVTPTSGSLLLHPRNILLLCAIFHDPQMCSPLNAMIKITAVKMFWFDQWIFYSTPLAFAQPPLTRFVHLTIRLWHSWRNVRQQRETMIDHDDEVVERRNFLLSIPPTLSWSLSAKQEFLCLQNFLHSRKCRLCCVETRRNTDSNSLTSIIKFCHRISSRNHPHTYP